LASINYCCDIFKFFSCQIFNCNQQYIFKKTPLTTPFEKKMGPQADMGRIDESLTCVALNKAK